MIKIISAIAIFRIMQNSVVLPVWQTRHETAYKGGIW
jgi:hypothetical protein